MKKFLLLTIFTAQVAAGWGQTPVRFRSTEWLGLESGQAGNSGAVQTVNGIAKGPWFVGAGVGLDYVRFRSVPLFLSATRDISFGNHEGLLIYLDGGINEPWYSRPAFYNITSSTFRSGQFWSGGLGYFWKLGAQGHHALLISAGYTVKKLKEDQTVGNNCYGVPCQLETPQNQVVVYEYLCRAYQFMIGFRF